MKVTRPGRPRPPPGEPVEFIVWRSIKRTAKGMRREVAYVASVDSDLGAVLVSRGVGRYRVEWRDRRRQLTHVEVFEVGPNGAWVRVPPATRSRPRKLPPPRYVAPGTHPALVPYAPEAPPPPPEPRRPPPRAQGRPASPRSPRREG